MRKKSSPPSNAKLVAVESDTSKTIWQMEREADAIQQGTKKAQAATAYA